MALQGSERKILHAILHEQGADAAGYVAESQIAQATDLTIEVVRDYLITLAEKAYVQRSVGTNGSTAYITASGRLELSQTPVISNEPHLKPAQNLIRVVPKGLRSFDEHDADFFLELLPGPRRSDGLPESIHFWKPRIEETDPDKTFRVGLIYGPSGCGKSSLVKAGLLPRLAKHVLSIYFSATPVGTESRLLNTLRKRCPEFPADLGLADLISALGDGRGLPPGKKKVLIVLDQFEQWLSAWKGDEESGLIASLPLCNGSHVQAIVMVRDDFWMAVNRFEEQLGVEFRRTLNSYGIDLFDPIHARKVLEEFGQAFGRLPDDREAIFGDQNTFLDRTVEGLAHNGKIVPIRLSLFAWMVRGKPWTPTTLKEVGGTEGVGVKFLDETFSSPHSEPKCRLHQKAAQAVLKALLPEEGTRIRGKPKSYSELLSASGYIHQPEYFDDLSRILDEEVRLITPTELEGPRQKDQNRSTNPDAGYYQLTHDYLVPSIQEWLYQEKRKTRQGRAELRLSSLSNSWDKEQENRHLPSLWEWLDILRWTEKKDWTDPQQKMMRRAGRLFAMRCLVGLLLIVATICTVLVVRQRTIEGQQATHALGLVQRLLDADTAQVPTIISAMRNHRRWVDPLLREEYRKASEGSRSKLHSSLALLPVDASQVEYLSRRLLKATPTELPVLRDALKPHRKQLTPQFWSVLRLDKPHDPRLLPAACALALYDHENTRWAEVGDKVAQALVSVNSIYLGDWLKYLRDVRGKLTVPLATIFGDRQRPESERSQATNILADYASDDPDLLADLLLESEEKPFAVLFERLKVSQDAGPLLESKLKKTKDSYLEAKEDEKDQLAQRQARATVALVRLEQGEEVWTLLRHSPDPSVRSYIVNWLKPMGADPKVLMTRLEGLAPDPVLIPKDGKTRMDAILFHPETSERRALILALGGYDADDLSPGYRESLVARLLATYRSDPDAGVHGAAEWTLRRWKQGETLKKVDADLQKLKDTGRGNRRWYICNQGHTMAVIDAPIECKLGSPPGEPGRLDDFENEHQQRIDWRFSIATKEVTVDQFQRFLKSERKEHPEIYSEISKNYHSNDAIDPDSAQIGVSWYDAAAYCNWLSHKEGLDACYIPNSKGEYSGLQDDEMKLVADARKKSGYRLPMEAEWEYCCRAGATTSRFYGDSMRLLGEYAWNLRNFPETVTESAKRCGLLKPNDFGLFDVLGNLNEWCMEERHQYDNPFYDLLNHNTLRIVASIPRIHRGGSLSIRATLIRSAFRGGLNPSYNFFEHGFRISRALP